MDFCSGSPPDARPERNSTDEVTESDEATAQANAGASSADGTTAVPPRLLHTRNYLRVGTNNIKLAAV